MNNNIIKPKYSFTEYNSNMKNNHRYSNKNNNLIIENDITTEDKRDEDDNSENKMIDLKTDREKQSSNKSLYEIIYRLKHNTDLNELINKINLILENKFDKRNMEIILGSNEFDKFEQINKCPEVKATIYYSLLEKQF